MAALATLALVLVLARVEARGQLSSEVAGGEAPLVSGQAPATGLTSSLRGQVELRLRLPDLQADLHYGPRLFWRIPLPTTRRRPLLLHSGAFTVAAPVRRTTLLQAGGAISAGETDYASLTALLGSSQGALPEVAEMMLATAVVGLREDLSPRLTLGSELHLLHRRPLGATPADPAVDPGTAFALARQSGARLELRLNRRLGRRDIVTAESSLAYERHTPGAERAWWQPQLAWRRRLADDDTFSLAAGLVYARSLSGAPGDPSPGGLSPVGELGYDGGLLRSRGLALRGRFTLQVEHWVDPVLDSAGPRGLLASGLMLRIGPRLMLGLEARLATSLQARPLPGSPDETLQSVALPLQVRFSDHLSAETGLRWSDRAPHVRAPAFRWHQRELWYYVAITATTTAASRPTSGP